MSQARLCCVQIQPCANIFPIPVCAPAGVFAGTYNNVLKALTGADDKPCTACPTGKTTDSSRLTGATAESQCDQCREGYGGTNCGSLCGGSTGTGATYGPARPDNSPACTVCPQMDPGFFFVANGATQYYRPLSLTRAGAGSATQCVAEFAQLEEQNWYLHGNATMFDVAATTLDTCVEACRSVSVCQYITFDYDNNKCQIKNTTADVARCVICRGGEGGVIHSRMYYCLSCLVLACLVLTLSRGGEGYSR